MSSNEVQKELKEKARSSFRDNALDFVAGFAIIAAILLAVGATI